MSTVGFLPGKRIVYDGGCTLCLALRERMLRWGWVPEESMVDYYALPNDNRQQVDAERFRREMAVIDLEGGATIYGAEGIMAIFAAKSRLVRWLSRQGWWMAIFRFLYQTLAYNRYVVATPRRDMPACDCAPVVPTRFHIAYLSWNLAWALGVTTLFGIALKAFLFPHLPLGGAGFMLLVAGTGWCLQSLIALLLMRSKAFDYLRHLSTIMRMGVMPLLFGVVVLSVSPMYGGFLAGLSVLFSSGLMLRQHYLRVWQLGISQVWTMIWFVGLQSTAIAWVAYFTTI